MNKLTSACAIVLGGLLALYSYVFGYNSAEWIVGHCLAAMEVQPPITSESIPEACTGALIVRPVWLPVISIGLLLVLSGIWALVRAKMQRSSG